MKFINWERKGNFNKTFLIYWYMFSVVATSKSTKL